MTKAAPTKVKKPAAAPKKAPAKPAVKAKETVAKKPAARPVVKAAKAAAKAAPASKKAPAKQPAKASMPKAKATRSTAPGKAQPKPPAVEVVVQGQRYIVGEYGSLMTFEEYERVMANKQ